MTSEFEKMTDSDFVKLHEDSMSDKKKWEEVKKRIEKERASMTPEERAGWDEADRAVFEHWMRRTPTPFLTDASLKEKTRISILSDESCELLSNFVSLTDCKQPLPARKVKIYRCELLSNFVSLTDCKQLDTLTIIIAYGCELLSNFVSLTDCKQLIHELKTVCVCCELLSNFVSLTDCKQRALARALEEQGCELLSNFVSLTDCKQLAKY